LKTVYEFADGEVDYEVFGTGTDGILRKKVRSTARNICGKSFMFDNEKKGLVKELSR